MTQAQFGDLVGISQPAVAELVRRGIIEAGAPAGTWLLAYCQHIRLMAAGRGGEGTGELVRERARLAAEQADKIAMQNAVARGELAPAHLLEQVLAKAGARAGRLLETIPALLKRRHPSLTADDIAEVARVVAKARNVAAAMTLADLGDDDERDDDAAAPEAEAA